MAEFSTTIRGCKVDLDTDSDGVGTTDCWVSKVCNVDGSGTTCNASLQCLQAGGYLTDHNGEDVESLPPKTLELISKWADEHGY